MIKTNLNKAKGEFSMREEERDVIFYECEYCHEQGFVYVGETPDPKTKVKGAKCRFSNANGAHRWIRDTLYPPEPRNVDAWLSKYNYIG